jgi:hypothetical protein
MSTATTTCGGCGHPAHEPNDECWYIDLGTCPYFARHHGLPGHDPEAICAYGCVDEPECVTCEPGEGWPSWPRRGSTGQEDTDG